MDASDPVLLTYRRAIKAMQALPTTDPRSWTYQAAIHWTTLTQALTAWNTCQHNAQFFWSWHRMYLYWFERIVRKLAGECEPCWCLPYWDWGSPAQRSLPAPFRDTASELFHASRDTAMNNGTGSLTAGAVDYSGAFMLPDFVSAAGSLSGGAHANVHVSVGGDMGAVQTAALDPIFYLHHANVDRLWDLWLAQGGGRVDPLNDASWKTTPFTFFDENGYQLQMTSCQVLRAAEQLDYVYEGEPDQVREYCERRLTIPPWAWTVLIKLAPIMLEERPVTVDMALGDVRSRLATLVQSKTEVVALILEEVSAERPPGVIWEVHAGAKNAADLSAASPSFVGTFAMFGEGIRSAGHHEPSAARFILPLRAEVLKRLSGSARVPLTFIPRGILIDGKNGPARPAAAVRIGQASLAVESQGVAGG
jgi:tyrosinase